MLTPDTARRCALATQCDPQTVHHRARTRAGADKRRAHTFLGWYVIGTCGQGRELYQANTATESVEDEDEVLTALSDELGGFVEYVGGPEYGHVLLSPLENLATIEEPLVRDKVMTYRTLLHYHPARDTNQYFPGRRIPKQNRCPTLPTPNRTILHPPHRPPQQSRLVHLQNLRRRSLQRALPTRYPSIPRRPPSTILPARPR